MTVLVRAVLPRVEPVQVELQAAVDWHSAAEQPRGTLPSSQLLVIGEVQVTYTPISIFTQHFKQKLCL